MDSAQGSDLAPTFGDLTEKISDSRLPLTGIAPPVTLQKSAYGNLVSRNHVSGGFPFVPLDSKSQQALQREQQANKGHVSIQAKSSHLTQQFI